MLCRIVGAAPSGFYAWLRRGPARRGGADRILEHGWERSSRPAGAPMAARACTPSCALEGIALVVR